jgi:signal transduction protein with GAF and PtsI domain
LDAGAAGITPAVATAGGGPDLAAAGWRSHLVAPLVAQDRLLGLLAVGRRRPEAYGAEDLRLLAIVAAHLAAYVDALAARAQAKMALRLLTRTGELLDAAPVDGATLGRLAELVVPELADWCAIAVLDAQGGLTRRALASTLPPADQERLQERALRPDAPIGAA